MDEQLIRNRKLVGWTQFDLARATGIPTGRITFAETGRTTLTKDEIAKVKSAIRKRAKEVASTILA